MTTPEVKNNHPLRQLGLDIERLKPNTKDLNAFGEVMTVGEQLANTKRLERKPPPTDEPIDDKPKMRLGDRKVLECPKHGMADHVCVPSGTGNLNNLIMLCNSCALERSVRQMQKEKQEKIAEHIAQNKAFAKVDNIPNLYKIMPYMHTPEQEQVIKICKDYLGVISNQKGRLPNLILQGKVGTGKTYLAKSIVSGVIDLQRSAYFQHTHTYIQSYKSRFQDFNDFKKLKQRCEKSFLLVLDDVGSMDWDNECIILLLEYRYENNLPTIITTNSNTEQLYEYFGDRVKDRFYERCISCFFGWESYRTLFGSSD